MQRTVPALAGICRALMLASRRNANAFRYAFAVLALARLGLPELRVACSGLH